MPQQNLWRYCDKCHAMFYDGYADKGHCPAGAGHEAQGYMFVLTHDVPATAAAQGSWRYCDKCHAMFFDGYTDKGHCQAGGGHESQGYMFVLPHDVPATPTAQNLWRYCQKCHVMFYDGYADKGHCAAGAGHQSQGYMFVLPHDIPIAPPPVQTQDWTWGPWNSGHIAVNSEAVSASSDGTWKWTAALHDDSTFYGDNYALGFAFIGLGHGSAASGTLGASLSGPSESGTVSMGGKDAWLAANYAAAVHAGVTSRLEVSGDIGQLFSGILDDLGTAAGDVLKLLSSSGGDGGDGGGDGDGGGEDIRRRPQPIQTDPNPVTTSASAVGV